MPYSLWIPASLLALVACTETPASSPPKGCTGGELNLLAETCRRSGGLPNVNSDGAGVAECSAGTSVTGGSGSCRVQGENTCSLLCAPGGRPLDDEDMGSGDPEADYAIPDGLDRAPDMRLSPIDALVADGGHAAPPCNPTDVCPDGTCLCGPLPSAETCDGESWRSAVEVPSDLLRADIIPVIFTIASNKFDSIEQPTVSAVKWNTALGDVVIIDGNTGRVIAASKCAMRGLGLIRRLDAAIADVAEIVNRAIPDLAATELALIACGNRTYFADSEWAYSRVDVATWSDDHATGILTVPVGARPENVGFAVCTYGWCNSCAGPLAVDGMEIFDQHRVGVSDVTSLGFEAHQLGGASTGAHSFSIDANRFCGGWCDGYRHPGRHFWFEVAGPDLAGAISATVNGATQPTLGAQPFEDLDFPGDL